MFLPKRSHQTEIEDGKDYTAGELSGNLRDLRLLNRFSGFYKSTIREIEKTRMLHGLSSLKILDVGTGSADLPIAIAKYFRKKRIPIKIVAIDANPLTIDIARQYARPYPEIKLKNQSIREIALEGNFDIVLCNLTLHHISDDQKIAAVDRLYALASKKLIINDVVRSFWAYWIAKLGTFMFSGNRLTRHDGPLSVLRSLTIPELKALLAKTKVGKYEIKGQFPFRIFILACRTDSIIGDSQATFSC